MKDFISASNVNILDIIENGYNPPSKIKNGILILKPRNSRTKEKKRKHKDYSMSLLWQTETEYGKDHSIDENFQI